MGKVGAPFGNKNGLIWTFEKSSELLDKAIELTNRKELVFVDKQEVEAYEFDFVGEIARELNVYHSLLTRDIPNQHPDLQDKVKLLLNRLEAYEFDFVGEIARELNVYRDLITRDIPKQHPDLQSKVNLLVNRLEANCYSNTKKGKINTAVGIVNLKSNHGWTDRQQIEQKQTNIDLSGLTTEEIKDLLNE